MICSKCECEAKPYVRMKLRENGKRTKSVASYCKVCHYEDQRVREERRYKKKLAYNRMWRKNNRDKVNEYNRIWYLKSRRYGEILQKGEYVGY